MKRIGDVQSGVHFELIDEMVCHAARHFTAVLHSTIDSKAHSIQLVAFRINMNVGCPLIVCSFDQARRLPFGRWFGEQRIKIIDCCQRANGPFAVFPLNPVPTFQVVQHQDCSGRGDPKLIDQVPEQLTTTFFLFGFQPLPN